MLQSKSTHFLEQARACRDKARAIPALKNLYLEMALDWETLASLAATLAADAAERDAFYNAHGVSRTDPLRSWGGVSVSVRISDRGNSR